MSGFDDYGSIGKAGHERFFIGISEGKRHITKDTPLRLEYGFCFWSGDPRSKYIIIVFSESTKTNFAVPTQLSCMQS